MSASTSNSRKSKRALRQAYALMHAHFGHQAWWPAKTPFEVCVGAILTQNTSWSNVERALQSLHNRNLLTPYRLMAIPEDELANLLRPAGYFRVKAKRLRAFLEVLIEQCQGKLEILWQGTIEQVRNRLLAIHGIGPETADCMLLYAGRHPAFVVDAYTARIFSRHGWCSEKPTYTELQQLAESALRLPHRGQQLDLWQDYHAQIVMVGKHYCRRRLPRCELCPLKSLLPIHARQQLQKGQRPA